MAKRSHISPRTRAYAKLGSRAYEVIVGAREDDGVRMPPSEHHYGWKPMWLMILGTGRPNWIHLTGLTEEELEKFRDLMNIAVDDALTIVRDLDRQAEELMMGGAEEIPMRALSSRPVWFERKVPLAYEVEIEPEIPESETT